MSPRSASATQLPRRIGLVRDAPDCFASVVACARMPPRENCFAPVTCTFAASFAARSVDTKFAPYAFKSFQAGRAPAQKTISVNVRGRYVRIQLSGKNFLSLAEVKVFGRIPGTSPTVMNLSRGKAARQSSTYRAHTPASRAVDGSTDGRGEDKISHTNKDKGSIC